jgi:NAD(P)-dependent dehydrogenase (short-subunit alcohol dehydrogenase family)
MTKKRVLLVGVSSGIGLMAAELILQNDVVVYAAAPDIEPMRRLEARGATLLEMDVTDTASVEQGVQQMIETEGGIDCVLYNAGLHVFGPIEGVSEAAAEMLYQVNVMGAARVIRAVTPQLRKQRSGRMIFTCSIVSHLSIMMSGWYASTKHALNGLLKAYRQEVGRFGIEVVMIEPGQINTGFEQASMDKLRNEQFPDDYAGMVEQVIGFTSDALPKCPTAEGTANDMERAVMTDKAALVYRTSTDAKLLPKLRALMGDRFFEKYLVNAFQKFEPE